MTRMTDGERRAYQRGYSHQMHGRWPDCGTIPDENYRRLLEAARALSDHADAFMASFDDRDTEPHMVAMDKARERIHAEVQAAIDATLATAPSPEPKT